MVALKDQIEMAAKTEYWMDISLVGEMVFCMANAKSNKTRHDRTKLAPSWSC